MLGIVALVRIVGTLLFGGATHAGLVVSDVVGVHLVCSVVSLLLVHVVHNLNFLSKFSKYPRGICY